MPRQNQNFQSSRLAITLLLGSCQSPFTLSHGDSCNLNLIAIDDKINQGISQKGPVVCKTNGLGDNQPSPFLCSQPASSDVLTIYRPTRQPGTLMCWGSNGDGQAGTDPTSNVNPAVPVQQLASNIISSAQGGFHTCALTDSGGIQCWGRNHERQLGNPSTDGSSYMPLDVTGLTSGVLSLFNSADRYTVCAIK